MLERVSPKVPFSEVIEATSSWLPDQVLAQVFLEVGRARAVPGDARHLDVVHRQHHPRGAAALRQCRALIAQFQHAGALPAEVLGHRGGQQPRLAQRGEGFGWKPRVTVHVVGVLGRHFPCDRGGAGDHVTRLEAARSVHVPGSPMDDFDEDNASRRATYSSQGQFSAGLPCDNGGAQAIEYFQQLETLFAELFSLRSRADVVMQKGAVMCLIVEDGVIFRKHLEFAQAYVVDQRPAPMSCKHRLRDRIARNLQSWPVRRVLPVTIMGRKHQHPARAEQAMDFVQRTQPALVADCIKNVVRGQHEVELRVPEPRHVAHVGKRDGNARACPFKAPHHFRRIVGGLVMPCQWRQINRGSPRADTDIQHVPARESRLIFQQRDTLGTPEVVIQVLPFDAGAPVNACVDGVLKLVHARSLEVYRRVGSASGWLSVAEGHVTGINREDGKGPLAGMGPRVSWRWLPTV